MIFCQDYDVAHLPCYVPTHRKKKRQNFCNCSVSTHCCNYVLMSKNVPSNSSTKGTIGTGKIQGCIFPIIRQFLRWNSFENLTHFRNSFYFWSVFPEFFFEKHEILGKNMKNMVLNAQKDELSLKISNKLNPSCI